MTTTFDSTNFAQISTFEEWRNLWTSLGLWMNKEGAGVHAPLLESLLHILPDVVDNKDYKKMNEWVPFVIDLANGCDDSNLSKEEGAIREKALRVLALKLFKKSPWGTPILGPAMFSDDLLTLVDHTIGFLGYNCERGIRFHSLPVQQSEDVQNSVKNMFRWMFNAGGWRYWRNVLSDERARSLHEDRKEREGVAKKFQSDFLARRAEFLPLLVKSGMLDVFLPKIRANRLDIGSLRAEDVDNIESVVCHLANRGVGFLDGTWDHFDTVEETVHEGEHSVNAAVCLMLKTYVHNCILNDSF